MYCGIDLTSNNCSCDKTIKPSKKNRTNQVPNFRNLAYKPDKIHEEIKKTISFIGMAMVMVMTGHDRDRCRSVKGL